MGKGTDRSLSVAKEVIIIKVAVVTVTLTLKRRKKMIFVPIIKPVGGSCNLSCAYCYFKDRMDNFAGDTFMRDDVLKRSIDEVCLNQKSVNFIWHGGEPLLAGIDFYYRALKHEHRWIQRGWNIYNSIQTNGTLVNEEWAEFFADNGFSVGVSIDGPLFFHNKLRKYPSKKGSLKEAMRGVYYLRKAGLSPDVICCVNAKNYKFPESVFNFLVEQGFSKIKFLQTQGRDKSGRLLSYSVSGEQYAAFLKTVLRSWIDLDNPNLEIREIKSILNSMLGGSFRECMFGGECYKYLTIYPDGAVYACDSLPNINNYFFGNISEGISSIESSNNFINFLKKVQMIQKECSHCKWFRVCRGGCLQDWWPDVFKSGSRNLFCEGLKELFTESKDVLKDYKLI